MKINKVLKFGASLLAVLTCSFNAGAMEPVPCLHEKSSDSSERENTSEVQWACDLLEELGYQYDENRDPESLLNCFVGVVLPSYAEVHGKPQHNSKTPQHGTESLCAALVKMKKLDLSNQIFNVKVYFNMELNTIFGNTITDKRRPDVTIVYEKEGAMHAIFIEVVSSSQLFNSQKDKCKKMKDLIQEKLNCACKYEVHYPNQIAKSSLTPQMKRLFSSKPSMISAGLLT